MRPTIWYISKYLIPSGMGSSGSRGYLLMSAIAKQYADCIIITSDSNAHLEATPAKDSLTMGEADGLTIIWLRTWKYKVAKSASRVLSWLHFEWRLLRLNKAALKKPDAIIVSSLSLLTILSGLILRRKYKCKLVFEVRDIWPLTLTAEGGFSRWNPLVMLLAQIEKLGYRKADLVVGTMPNLVEHVKNLVPSPPKVITIPMGIDRVVLEDSEPLAGELVKKVVNTAKFKIVYAGSIGISNALETFFECAERMASNPDIGFLVAGDGDLRAHYQVRFGRLSNLVFLGRIPRKQVQTLLNHADLLYLSVHDSEVWKYGQSLNKLVDYMYSGKPILASYNGYRSMINEAECGSFVPVGNIELLEAEILRYSKLPSEELLALGKRGRDWLYRNRSYEKLGEEYFQAIFPTQKAAL